MIGDEYHETDYDLVWYFVIQLYWACLLVAVIVIMGVAKS